MALSYSAHTNLTYALLLFRPQFPPTSTSINTPTYDSIIQSLTDTPLLATNPLLLPILIADISNLYSDNRIQSADGRLTEIEQASGQHEWVDLKIGDPLKLDFLLTTKQLNFTSRALGMEIWRHRKIRKSTLSLRKLLRSSQGKARKTARR
jgi:hypothetical protein